MNWLFIKIKNLNQIKNNMTVSREILRKLFHLLAFLIVVAFYKLGKENFAKFFIPITMLVVAIDYSRCKISILNKATSSIFSLIMRDKELHEKKLSGMSWLFLSASFNFALFEPVIAITGFCILIFADSIAAVIGKSIKSPKFFQKSLAGSIAFLVVSIAIIIAIGLIFKCRPSFFFFAILVAIYITYLEAYPALFNIDDNFLIPIAFGISMTMLNFMWHIV